MLLEFAAENYKSFRDRFVLSMRSASRQMDFADTILREKIGKRSYRAVSVAILYGPNAAGKTNVISALDTFRAIVRRGNILNPQEDAWGPNGAAMNLELIPHISSKPGAPTEFSITFIADRFLIQYSFSVALGGFLQKDYERSVVREVLAVNDVILFERDGQDIQWVDPHSVPRNIRAHLSDSSIEEPVRKAIASNLLKTSLLLPASGLLLGPFFPDLTTNWISKRLQTACSSQFADTLVPPGTAAQTMNYEGFLSPISAKVAAEKLGSVSGTMGYNVQDGQVNPLMYSLIEQGRDAPVAIPSEYFESVGTVRFARVFDVVRQALRAGSVLVMDEFDASLHPSAVYALISLFHNDEINTKKAQLIFNTHNPVYLNRELCRRDELKFVAKNEDGVSETWSLSDFGTSGPEGVRRGDNYLRAYMKGEYGAIDRIDLSDVFATGGVCGKEYGAAEE